MTTFNIIRYTGKNNNITKRGKEYISLPWFLDNSKHIIYGKYDGSVYPYWTSKGLCKEDVENFKVVGNITLHHIDEYQNVLSAAKGYDVKFI